MSLRVREITPRGCGGLSVLSIEGRTRRGRSALEVLGLLSGRRELRVGSLSLVRVKKGDDVLDEAIVAVVSEEEVELHLHGSPPLVRRVVSLLVDLGEAPESDLALESSDPRVEDPESMEDRAFHRLGSAASDAGARILLDQAEGALRRELLQLAEASSAEFERLRRGLIERGRLLDRALAPALVVIAGPANAGKSTLFNALLGRERALINAEPGTTRDALVERCFLGPWPVDLVDTAGERDLSGTGGAIQVELAGQGLAREIRAEADLVLWLERGGTRRAARPQRSREILVWSCADVGAWIAFDGPAISALRAPEQARQTIARLFQSALDLPPEPWTPDTSGRGAPFEPEQVAALLHLSAEMHPSKRRTEIERLMGPA